MKRWLLFVALMLCVGLPFALAETDEAKQGEGTPEGQEAKAEAAADAPKVDPLMEQIVDMVRQAQAVVRGMNDATYIFYKHEWKDGKMLNPEKTFTKWRKNPRSVYMRWIGDHNTGQEILWVKGKNRDRIRAHEGKGISTLIPINLDPTGRMAMRESRHPVMHAGFDHTVNLIAGVIELAQKHPGSAQIRDVGKQNIHGVQSQCYEATLDKKKYPNFYCYKALICAHPTVRLPNKVHIWDFEDGAVRLVEQYSYEQIKVNVGLKDSDFDTSNPEYSF